MKYTLHYLSDFYDDIITDALPPIATGKRYGAYTDHKKFMNTSTSAKSMASFILEGRYLENQTP